VAAGRRRPLPVEAVEEGYPRFLGFYQGLDEDGAARGQHLDHAAEGGGEVRGIRDREREELPGVGGRLSVLRGRARADDDRPAGERRRRLRNVLGLEGG